MASDFQSSLQKYYRQGDETFSSKISICVFARSRIWSQNFIKLGLKPPKEMARENEFDNLSTSLCLYDY